MFPCLASSLTRSPGIHLATRPAHSVDLEVTAPTTPPPINAGQTRPTTTTRAPVVGSALAGTFKTPNGACVENFGTCCCMMGMFQVTSDGAATTMATNLMVVNDTSHDPLCARISGEVEVVTTLTENDGYSFTAMDRLGRADLDQVRHLAAALVCGDLRCLARAGEATAWAAS